MKYHIIYIQVSTLRLRPSLVLLLSGEGEVEGREQSSSLRVGLGSGMDGNVHTVHLQVGVLVGLDLGEVLDILGNQTKGHVTVSVTGRVVDSVEADGSGKNQLGERSHKVGNLLASNLHLGAHGVALSQLPRHDVGSGSHLLGGTASDLLQQQFLVNGLFVVQSSAGICAVDGDFGDHGDVLPCSGVDVLGGGLVRTSGRLGRSSQMVGRRKVPRSVLVTLSHTLLVHVAHEQEVAGHGVVVMVGDSVLTGVFRHVLVGLDGSGMGQQGLGEGRLEDVFLVPVEVMDGGLDRHLGATGDRCRGVE